MGGRSERLGVYAKEDLRICLGAWSLFRVLSCGG